MDSLITTQESPVVGSDWGVTPEADPLAFMVPVRRARIGVETPAAAPVATLPPVVMPRSSSPLDVALAFAKQHREGLLVFGALLGGGLLLGVALKSVFAGKLAAPLLAAL